MDKATILGVYDFIGYGLCEKLLGYGVEVEGIHLAKKKEIYFTEEKRLEIGRNANFKETGLQEWDVDAVVEFLFIELFEGLRYGRETAEYIEDIIGKLENSTLKKYRSILILPAYFAQENVLKVKPFQHLQNFLEKKQNILTIYVPTIFGPWQPEDYFFQQALSNIKEEWEVPQPANWEWTHDALYIDDAVTTILELAEADVVGEILLASGEKNRWIECAEYLMGQDEAIWRKNPEPTYKKTIQVRAVRKNEQYSRGLRVQKEHYCRILESRV